MYPPPPDLWSGGFFVHAPAGTPVSYTHLTLPTT